MENFKHPRNFSTGSYLFLHTLSFTVTSLVPVQLYVNFNNIGKLGNITDFLLTRPSNKDIEAVPDNTR